LIAALVPDSQRRKVIDETLVTARASKPPRAEALAKIALLLPSPEREAVLAEIIDTVTTRYRDDGMKAWHFAELAYLLPPGPLLDFATTISEEHRSRLIIALAPHLLTEELLGEAVDAAFAIHDQLCAIPTIATTDSDGSRPPIPIDRDQCGAGC
jgi:hypothetical protein